MQNNTSNVTAATWLIGGLAVGALINYVLDPERGRRRRAMLADKISDTVSTTSDYLGQKANEVGSKVNELRDRSGSVLGEQLELLPDNLKQTMTDPRFWRRAANRELWMLGGAVLGALGMYLADPEMGRRRRATANDKLRSAASSTRDYMSSTTRDLGNRAQGLMASARSKMPSVLKSDESSEVWQTH